MDLNGPPQLFMMEQRRKETHLDCQCAFDNRERYREQYITVYRMTRHAEHQAELPAMKTKPKFIFFTDFVRHSA